MSLRASVRAPTVAASYKAARKTEETFYSDLFLRFGITSVFDIGGNCGDKTEVFLDAGASSVVLIEPDPHWSKIHRWRFEKDPRVELCKCAVSSSNSTAVFHRFAPGSPLNTLEQRWVQALSANNERFECQSLQDCAEVETLTVATLVDRYGQADYCKVDVEGHELSVLKGIQELPSLVSLEFNLPEFQKELEESLVLVSEMWPGCGLNFVSDYERGLEL